MSSLNKVFLIGHLTRSPELRVTPKGTAITQFGLAINRKFKDESGAERDETTFVDIEAWGKQGELVAKYLGKGSQCMVEGRLKLDQWEDAETKKKRSRLKVVLDNVQFLGAPKDKREEAPKTDTYAHTPEKAPTRPAPPPPAEDPDSDVPFNSAERVTA